MEGFLGTIKIIIVCKRALCGDSKEPWIDTTATTAGQKCPFDMTCIMLKCLSLKIGMLRHSLDTLEGE